jgi:hypothetical protein
MGFWTSAYLAYGIEIPDTNEETLEERLGGETVGVSYLRAGAYDTNKTYLTACCESADLGDPENLDLAAHYTDGNPEGRWNDMLAHAVEKVGLESIGEPGWLLIADVS